MVELVRDPFDQIGTANDSACHNIGVAIEIFCAAMEREVKTPLRGSEIDRAQIRTLIFADTRRY